MAGFKYDFNIVIRYKANPPLMRALRTISLLLFLSFQLSAWSQDEEFSNEPSIAVSTGIINYQGDLNPNSFTLGRSKFTIGATIRKPISKKFIARAGVNFGHLEAADRYNRDYLQSRNLSFYTTIKEAYAGLEFNFFNISKTRFTPYIYGGIAVFHFNPWAYDNDGNKTYLQPLSTEGQGLADFPTQKSYKLTQFAIPFGAGIKYALSDNINIGIEFSQRKTFTDYLDDVSSFYVDYQKLLASKGPKAVEMAYRGLSSPNSSAGYPAHGEQRGTPSEMDWYYFTGINIEMKFGTFSNLFNGSRDKSYQQRCPRRIL
jgi:Domain of unknown function (DUF6089)